MADQRLKNLQGNSRRNFLRFTAAAGALFALDRAKVLDVLSDSAGSALADDACQALPNRTVHFVGGTGGFAWFNLIWPQVGCATGNNPAYAFHAPGKQIKASDTDKPFYFAPESPWQDRDKNKRISAFMAGTTVVHSNTPTAALGAGQSMLAVCASIQRAAPSLLPVIGIDPVDFGNAPGRPDIATVGDANGMIELFNSSASRAILSVPQDGNLYEAYYKAFLSLNKATARPTYSRQLKIGKASANFLGKNLSAQLTPSSDDLTRYNIDDSTPSNVAEIGRALITTARAFKLGLTQSVIIPSFLDDPHGAFGDMNKLNMTVQLLGNFLNQFLADLDVPDPGCTGKKYSDTTILTCHGDTPKDPYTNSGWPDGVAGNSNWLYVMGNGYLKTGWFGGLDASGNVTGFDPSTGQEVPNQTSDQTADAAGAAVAYAVAKGDIRRVQDFYKGPALDGIVNKNLT